MTTLTSATATSAVPTAGALGTVEAGIALFKHSRTRAPER